MSLATYFEWEIKLGGEEASVAAWAAATRHLLDHGSNGSALFRTDAGNFAAVARWPDRATRDAGFATASFPDTANGMSAQIIRTVHRIDLEGVLDLWTCTAS